jgi:type II secretory pathway pseudopilin PulG
MAQDIYQNDWKKVKAFDEQGLPKSAMETVETILDKAKKEQNSTQVIKALIHQAKYMLALEEDAQLNIISTLKNEIDNSQFPTKNILESILANLYWQYFNQNQWQFYNRTHTSEKVDQEDFRTWDLETLFAEIHTHYQKSLESEVLAQQENLDKFDILLSNGYHSKEDTGLHSTISWHTVHWSFIKPRRPISRSPHMHSILIRLIIFKV